MHGVVGRAHHAPGAALLGQRRAVASTTRCDHVDEVDVVGVEHGGAGVEAADLEQVGQQRLEPVQLGLQQLGGARGRPGRSCARASWSTSPAIRTVVSGVRSSCETSETKRRCTRVSSSSWRIWRCRLVAIWLNDVASRARSSSPRTRSRSSSCPAASRSATRRASRTGVTTCRVTSQVSPATSSSSRTAGGQQRAGDQRQRLAAPRRAGRGSRACRCGRPPGGSPVEPTTMPGLELSPCRRAGERADGRCRSRRSGAATRRSGSTSDCGTLASVEPRRRTGCRARRARCAGARRARPATTSKPRASPLAMIGSTRSRRCARRRRCRCRRGRRGGSCARRRSRCRPRRRTAVDPVVEQARRWICCSRNQPTALTTTVESSTVLTTTRAWIERRQKVRPRRSGAGTPVGRLAGVGARGRLLLPVPAL